MARCDCAGGRCSCAITPGDGVEITGSGEATNPYTITAIRQPITGQLAVDDTDTLDLTLTGIGDVNEPYRISGNVLSVPPGDITGLIDAGANVTITGSGTSADPYIIAADEADEITGLIDAGTNITFTGTGTTADPYIVSTSAEITPDAITGLIEAGTNVTFNGTGTTADPYVVNTATDITPNAITGLIEPGTNITINGTGTTADPYIIAGTTADPVITGLMEAGTNIQLTGSGTSADPYVVNSVQSLNDLSDVVITSPAQNQIPMYNAASSQWVNIAPFWVPTNPQQRGLYLTQGTTTWDPGTVAAGAQISTTITVPGASTSGMWVFDVASTSNRGGLHAWAAVTTTNVVTLYLSNMTANAVNLSSATWRVYGWR